MDVLNEFMESADFPEAYATHTLETRGWPIYMSLREHSIWDSIRKDKPRSSISVIQEWRLIHVLYAQRSA